MLTIEENGLYNDLRNNRTCNEKASRWHDVTYAHDNRPTLCTPTGSQITRHSVFCKYAAGPQAQERV